MPERWGVLRMLNEYPFGLPGRSPQGEGVSGLVLGSSTRRRTSVPIATLVRSPGTIVAIALMHRRVTLKGAVAAHAHAEEIVIAQKGWSQVLPSANFKNDL